MQIIWLNNVFMFVPTKHMEPMIQEFANKQWIAPLITLLILLLSFVLHNALQPKLHTQKLLLKNVKKTVARINLPIILHILVYLNARHHLGILVMIINVWKAVLKDFMLIIHQDYVKNHMTALVILMETQHLKLVYRHALLTIMQIFDQLQNSVFKHVQMTGILMTRLNNV